MTCIVGIEHDGQVLIGGDSAGSSSSWSMRLRADTKVFQTGEFVMGFTSSFRMGQLLRYKLKPPPFVEGIDLEEHMTTVFVETVRTVLRDGGYTKTDSGREQGGCFLVGIRGRLFEIASDFQVARSIDGYEAIGMGDELALGALFATADLSMSPRDRCELALNAAAHFSAGVSAPFAFVEA